MKILVLSDSHSHHSLMESAVAALKPDRIFHLGDYLRDGKQLADQYPQIPFVQVPGNCDSFRNSENLPEIRIVKLDGVSFYLTHGHLHGVKSYLSKLILDAEAAGADAVLFGHTHQAHLHQEESGMWVMNPGSCGYFHGSVGLITIFGGKIASCRVYYEEELEEML